jgi:hypothetical protein
MPIKRDARGRFANNGGRASAKPGIRAGRVAKATQRAGQLQGAAKASIAASKTKDGKFNLTPKAKTQLKQAGTQLKIVNKDAGKRLAAANAAKARDTPAAPKNDAEKAKAWAAKQKAKPSTRTPAEQAAAKARRAAAGQAYTAAMNKASAEKAALTKPAATASTSGSRPSKAKKLAKIAGHKKAVLDNRTALKNRAEVRRAAEKADNLAWRKGDKAAMAKTEAHLAKVGAETNGLLAKSKALGQKSKLGGKRVFEFTAAEARKKALAKKRKAKGK